MLGLTGPWLELFRVRYAPREKVEEVNRLPVCASDTPCLHQINQNIQKLPFTFGLLIQDLVVPFSAGESLATLLLQVWPQLGSLGLPGRGLVGEADSQTRPGAAGPELLPTRAFGLRVETPGSSACSPSA